MPSRRSARTQAARALGAAAWALTRLSRRLEEPGRPDWRTLAGDRDLEWAWALAHLRGEPGRVLDLGAGNGFLSLAAAMRGHDVVAVDLGPRSFSFVQARIDYRRGDFNKLGLEQGSFDQVLCCSTIEHIGLGGRYGSAEQVDADLEAAHRVAAVLRVGGTMVLTLPVGQDDVFPRRHRVYGAERLPRLLEPFVLESEEYRVKRAPGLWEPAGRHDALAVSGSSTFYALGLFQLRPR